MLIAKQTTIKLALKSKNIFVPQDMYVLTIGNTIMSGLIAPKITIAEFDCFKIGQQAVKVYNFLKKNSDISSITTRISGEIIARESTGEAPIIKKTAVVENSNYVNFYADSDVKKIFSLENFFKGIDDFDQHILNGLICNKKYSELSEELFASESTIKYHVKRMIDLVGCKTTAELIETLKEYIDF